MSKILITGSSGLIGTALCRRLRDDGHDVVPFDIRAPEGQERDVACYEDVRQCMEGCEGVVHLAAVSRVMWAERDPDLCWRTNITGTHNLLSCALSMPKQVKWFLFASSREVYGNSAGAPPDAPGSTRITAPINVYGRAKVAGEQLVAAAFGRLCVSVLRFSNVYGSTHDHADRVIPAFCRAALQMRPLTVEGYDRYFDFTYLPDVVEAICLAISKLREGKSLPTVEIVSGTSVSLLALARLCVQESGRRTSFIEKGAPRAADVGAFVGDPTRAQEILGWVHKTDLQHGIVQLLRELEPTMRGEQQTLPDLPESRRPS